VLWDEAQLPLERSGFIPTEARGSHNGAKSVIGSSARRIYKTAAGCGPGHPLSSRKNTCCGR